MDRQRGAVRVEHFRIRSRAMRRSQAYRVLALCWFIGACAPAATTPPAAPKAAQAQPPADPLYVKLGALPPAQSVLEALPESLRAAVDAALDRADDTTRRALLDPESRLVTLRPLLHLAAGGNETRAYVALCSSNAAADELVQLSVDAKLASSPETIDNYSSIVNEIGRRAAGQLLNAYHREVAPGVRRSVETVGEIAGAASIIDDHELELAAIDALATLADSPVVRLRRLRLLSQLLRVEEGRRSLKEDKVLSSSERGEATRWLDAAERLRGGVGKSADLTDRIEVARAALVLARPRDAQTALGRRDATDSLDLRVATTRARIATGDGPCPELQRELANAPLCRRAWSDFRKSLAFTELAPAWAANRGRDGMAVDTFLGLVDVTALLYGFDAAAGGATAESYAATLADLEQRAAETSAVSAHLGAVSLMARTLRLAFSASLNATDSLAAIAPEERSKLLASADTLARTQPPEPFNQSAVLAVTGVLAQVEDGSVPLAALSGKVESELQLPFGALTLWNSVASGDVETFKREQNYFGAIAQNAELPSLERSRWLLLWAEAEHHLAPTERTQATLSALASKLTGNDVPLDLRLRAALNLAGLAARTSNWDGALESIRPVADIPHGSVRTRQEQELLIVATAYRAVLEAKKDPSQLEQRALELESLLRNVSAAAAASPALQAWMALWRGELESDRQAQKCGKNTGCLQRARRALGIDPTLLAKAVGARSAALLQRGVLAIGGVQVEFHYQTGRLIPVVSVDASFLHTTMPALSPATTPKH